MANSLNFSKLKRFFGLILLGLLFTRSQTKQNTQWGFAGHQRINEFAVYLLPAEVQAVFIQHLPYLISQSVAPDQRRYAVEAEAARHYIDLDHYYHKGQDPFWNLPQNWQEAIDCHSEDTLQAYGIVPWHVLRMKYRLQKAFETQDLALILKYAAEIGHYIADAHVPLHTTENYNGQLTNQYGIHGLWESRLIELQSENYNYWIGKATYLPSVQKAIWAAVRASHVALDSVLQFEKKVSTELGLSEKYAYEQRGSTLTKVYSRKFCDAYHKSLNGMVERRLRAAILMVSSVWYTAWVDAGQPGLSQLKLQTDQKNDLSENDSILKTHSRWKQRSCH
ncbi:MAG: zinc dependent phospholipase C family protein [Crocinitomicaceae bacterium]|nr:zinc dependent phospholipase C family protein [Crocinitomicaceae bacterium]MDP4723629.1 zinc dependent phospholipase C family protein [Crocinitomicaceae bacterium]MDP4738899.1 zinc dependent phospholipase C family protein [Crocinitomicaceae bacterium]MDP4798993.1 zinc dependent phospholipase C family protein [Crocinitomicaceae bacterium]MDP4868815.1 zinc dependent phospholipase C family protein [Crocinitomicaceae bacterium]